MAAYKQAIDVLTQYGAMPMVGVLELEVKKEQRRQRIAANEAPAVAAALADLEAAKAADERRHRLHSDEAKPAVARLLRDISDTRCWSASPP